MSDSFPPHLPMWGWRCVAPFSSFCSCYSSQTKSTKCLFSKFWTCIPEFLGFPITLVWAKYASRPKSTQFAKYFQPIFFSLVFILLLFTTHPPPPTFSLTCILAPEPYGVMRVILRKGLPQKNPHWINAFWSLASFIHGLLIFCLFYYYYTHPILGL